MDGFFDKYGRVIIIAVAICFVLLFLTPMRNVVGSSINGFAGNFANKVGESLGTVKMPDGSVAKEKSSKLITGEEFSNKIPDKARTVVFTNEKTPEGIETTSLSQEGDVVGWLDGRTWKVSTQNSNKVVNFNENSSKMFYQKMSLTNIEFNNVDTSNVTDMGDMFYNCQDLTSLDLSSFDTSNVTNMRKMFFAWGRPELTSLDLSSFNTSKVTDMSYMFYNCPNLTSLDLSSFDTSNVTDMDCMFYECPKLTSLDLSSFDTSKVTDMSWMFADCSNLTSVNLSSFTSNITDMSYMFYCCSKLTSLDLSGFNTSKVTDMEDMFGRCSNLQTIKARSQTDIDKLKTKSTKVDSSVKFEIA